jgi:sulfur-carrier protein adenylyltransferase/sulfurtransferase
MLYSFDFQLSLRQKVGKEGTMKKIVALLPVIVFFALGTVCHVEAADKTPEQFVKEAKAAIREVSIDDVRKMIDAKENIILLDVRDKHEFEEGHIPGALNVSRGSLEFKAALVLPDKSARIVVYCGLDLRSPLATRGLNDLGYKNAVNLIGGLKAWKEAGYPIGK